MLDAAEWSHLPYPSPFRTGIGTAASSGKFRSDDVVLAGIGIEAER